MRVKCLAQEPELEPRPLAPETNALTIRPLRLQCCASSCKEMLSVLLGLRKRRNKFICDEKPPNFKKSTIIAVRKKKIKDFG